MADQKQNPTDIPPTPSIVITLDRFSAQASQSIQHIYLRSDEKRKGVTEFWDVHFDETSAMIQIIPLVDSANDAEDLLSQTGRNLQLRKRAFQCAVINAQEIKKQLEQIIRQMRTHARLIAAGWGQVYDVPLNIFLLADACDPGAAGMVLPWLTLFIASHRIIRFALYTFFIMLPLSRKHLRFPMAISKSRFTPSCRN